jgi:hypothetical protein
LRKKLTILFVFIISQFNIAGQNSVKLNESKDTEILVRCFEELPENKYLDSIGLSLSKKKKFCYLWTCFSQLSDKNLKLNEEIYKRLKDIARKLHSENKAVIIIGGCKDYIEEKSINGKNIRIINIGDCSGCIKFKETAKGVKIFNDKIKSLFGIIE